MSTLDFRPAPARALAPARFDAFDFARGVAILGMLGSHLVGTEGGATAVERGITGALATIEPSVGALFCVLAGISWAIQAERAAGTPGFRRYLAGRAAALGAMGLVFHVLFWKTEILVPFALMMALSLLVIGSRPRASAVALAMFVAVTPLVSRVAAPYADTDWLADGLHLADSTVGWATVRYLLVDGNYPLASWMAFPLLGICFWQTARSRAHLTAWGLSSLGGAVLAVAIAGMAAPADSVTGARRWIASGWTPTSVLFLLSAGTEALVLLSMLRWWWSDRPLPRFLQPIVLLGRASLTHYLLHIAVAYSLLRMWFPGEDWSPATGLGAILLYLAVTVPLTVFWFRRHTHGPVEALLARISRRPPPPSGPNEPTSRAPVEVIRTGGAASLRAVRAISRGEIVIPLVGVAVRRPTRFTIQVGVATHLDPVIEADSPWGSLNHGCDPNVVIDVSRRAIVARRAIAGNEELRFDYNTTEWELAEPFDCNCAGAGCVGAVRGFAHLPPLRQRLILREAAPHIRALYATRKFVDNVTRRSVVMRSEPSSTVATVLIDT